MANTRRPYRALSVLCGFLLFSTALPAVAQEFTLFGGKTTVSDLSESTYAWKLDYRQGLGEHFEASFSWLNEGHVTDHHRDGHTLQLWARENLFDRRLSLAFGAGPYRYYDTQPSTSALGSADVHGWAALLSFDAAAYLGKRWIARAEVNRSLTDSKSIDTWDFVLGVGYQLTPPETPGPRAWPERQAEATTESEITVFAGRTVVNTLNSNQSPALSLEYRRGLSRYFDVSAAFLYEGDSGTTRQTGVLVEGWFGRAFLHERLTLALGLGVYFAITRKNVELSGDNPGSGALIITPSASYRFGEHWLGRFSWNRFATNYDHDTDVFTFGLGYRF